MFGLELLVFSLVFVARGVLMKPSAPGTTTSKASLNDFDFTTNSSSRTVPILFGTAKFSGNLLYRGKLNTYDITEDGGKKRGDITVGTRYHLTYRISWCRSLDGIKSFYVNNKKVNDFKDLNVGINKWKEANNQTGYGGETPDLYMFPLTNYPANSNSKIKMKLQTGINSTNGGSNYGNSVTNWYNGSQVKYRETNVGFIPYDEAFRNLMGDNIRYKNTCYTFFDSGYIGDNVSRLPEYKIVGVNLGNKNLEDQISGINNSSTDDNGNIDVFYLLRYIFKNFLDKNVSINPWTDPLSDLYYSEEDYNEILFNDKLYLSFLMTSEKTVKEWIEEILKHIDRVIFYNFFQSRYEVKLIRDNYDINNSIVINEDSYLKLKVIKKDYKDIKSKININYTHPETHNETTISWVNEANLENNINEETYDFNMIRNHDYASKVLKRLIKKEAYPLTSFKFTLPSAIVEGTDDFNIKPGDILNFNNNKLGMSNFPVRVISMEGGKEEELEYDFICTEDIYNINDFSSLNFEVNTQEDFNYSLNDLNINNVLVIDTPREMTSLNNDAVLPIVAEDETDDEIVNGFICQDGLTGSKRTISYKGSYREVDGDFITTGSIIERNINLIVKNTINFKEINGSEGDFQRMKYSGVFEDGEFFCLKTITDNLDGTYTINGMIRGLANTTISNKSNNSKVYFVLDGTVANSLKSLNVLPRVNKTIYINKFNNRSIGNKLSKSHTYDNTVKKPYSPRNVKSVINGSNTDISWGATRRLRGRNYRSPEIIVSGEDEGTNEEGIKYIITHGSNIYETTDLNISIPHITGSFTIKSNIGRYFSNEETINIV